MIAWCNMLHAAATWVMPMDQGSNFLGLSHMTITVSDVYAHLVFEPTTENLKMCRSPVTQRMWSDVWVGANHLGKRGQKPLLGSNPTLHTFKHTYSAYWEETGLIPRLGGCNLLCLRVRLALRQHLWEVLSFSFLFIKPSIIYPSSTYEKARGQPWFNTTLVICFLSKRFE